MPEPDPTVLGWPETAGAIKRISEDNRSGAAEILRDAARVFALAEKAVGSNSPVSAHEAAVSVQAICDSLLAAQPDMAPLFNLARRVRSSPAVSESGDAAAIFAGAAESARQFAGSVERWARDAAVHLADHIARDRVVLTHSRSSTVLTALGMARRSGKSFKVFITESRPLMEGRAVAAALAGDGIPVTLIADAAAALVMDEIDIVVIGADRVTENYVVNKIGSYMIALAARQESKPFYVVADSSKLVGSSEASPAPEALKPANELWPEPPVGVAVVNRYFEQIPLGLITGVVTENGFETAAAIAKRIQKMIRG